MLGSHTLKFGGEFRYLQVNERNLASPDGAFVFDGTVTGNDFADYLIGAPTGAGGGFTQAALQLLDSRTRYGGAYAQDTWKVRPNLTLNLGLRWEVSSPWYDTQGKIQTWVPGKQSRSFRDRPKGWYFPAIQAFPRRSPQPNTTILAHAWDWPIRRVFTTAFWEKSSAGRAKPASVHPMASTTPQWKI